MGTSEPEFVETMKLKEGEEIQYVSCAYSSKGIHTITFKTNLDNILLAESEDEHMVTPL